MALRSATSPNGPPQPIPSSDSRESDREDTNKSKDGSISRTMILIVLATTVAAVTFVMGFTCKKLYMSSAPDLSIGLVKTAVFAVFVMCTSITMLTSVAAVMFLVWSKLESYFLLKGFLFLRAMGLVEVAFVSMVVAIMLGVCLVVTLVPWHTYFT